MRKPLRTRWSTEELGRLVTLVATAKSPRWYEIARDLNGATGSRSGPACKQKHAELLRAILKGLEAARGGIDPETVRGWMARRESLADEDALQIGLVDRIDESGDVP